MSAPACRVLLVEGDPFARQWLSYCLRADGRIELAGSAAKAEDIRPILRVGPVDLVLLNCDLAESPGWVFLLAQYMRQCPDARVVCAGVRPNPALLRDLRAPIFQGYILKGEMGGSPAQALHLAMRGYWVMSPSICAMAGRESFFPNRMHELLPYPAPRLREE